eukprot:TRINITY_DN1052_c0_g1_i1.p2 TRINITY_DN1052_c0_g1~~TRINITY_DN1052_c0_g1_i1.p2  ORF type:complete len:250 (+),score=62.15 TRINITY_DN1052_c0_g1_i1:280-1029(+)
MPPSALHQLEMMEAEYPMTFEITGPSGQVSHCGVYEFTASDQTAFMPFWIMQNIGAQEGDPVRIRYVRLPKGTYIRLQAQHVDFLDISNPRAVLEKELRGFAALTQGDLISIRYNEREYKLRVVETRPAEAISTTDTDLILEFDAPVGYKSPTVPLPSVSAQPPKTAQPVATAAPASQPQSQTQTPQQPPAAVPRMKSFPSSGYRLDGRPVATAPEAQQQQQPAPVQSAEQTVAQPPPKHFPGGGYTLR